MLINDRFLRLFMVPATRVMSCVTFETPAHATIDFITPLDYSLYSRDHFANNGNGVQSQITLCLLSSIFNRHVNRYDLTSRFFNRLCMNRLI